MTVLEFILPALVVILLSLPLIKVFTGKVSVKSAKIRLATHVAGFAGAVCLALYWAAVTNGVYAEETAVITGTIAQGLGFVAAALATANETPKIALAPNLPLFLVPSNSIRVLSM